jgi:hypothetical protein
MKVSISDPNYFMPLQNSFRININFEPIPGTLTITP